MIKTGTKIKVVFQALAAATVLLAVSLSYAEDKAKYHTILQKFIDEGGKVEFLGNAYGTDGWLLTNTQGGVRYAYTTPEGALIIGMMFSPDGTLETKKQLQAYKARSEGAQEAAPGAEKSSDIGEKVYAATETSNWVAVGNEKAPYIYMLVNVGCDHCQAFWNDLQGPIKAGTLQVRLVPFGEIENNRDGAAALLSVDNPAAAWQAYINGDKDALGKDKIKEGASFKVGQNNALAQNWKGMAPPYTLYRRTTDGKVTAIVGRPENLMLLLADFLK